MDEQSILELLLSSQSENIALAEQLLIGAGIPLIQLLDKFGYSQIGVTNFFWFEKTDWSIGNLTTETIPKLPASVESLILWDMKVNRFCLRNEDNLEEFKCHKNKLSKLSVENCGKLDWLTCYDNLLDKLILQNCPSLYSLYCSDNKLTELNLQGFSLLEGLVCENNLLQKLDLRGCVSLKRLYCPDNYKLTEIDLKDCVNLNALSCDGALKVLNRPPALNKLL